MERKHFKTLTDEERKKIKQEVFRQVNIEGHIKPQSTRPWKSFVAYTAAASLIAAITLLLLYTANDSSVRKLIAQTSSTEIRQVILTDSSVVILSPSSALYSAPGYATGKRELFLEGNAFFKVRKMAADRRFIVHAGKQSVSVLGTQFNMNTRTDDLEVVLTSGSVKITSDDNTIAPAHLKPGDKLIYHSNSGEYQKTKIDTLLYSPWINGEWKFRNTSLGEIAPVVAEYYNVSVSFNKAELKDLKMTAVFPVTNLETLLKVITETLPVKISKQQQQIIIQ